MCISILRSIVTLIFNSFFFFFWYKYVPKAWKRKLVRSNWNDVILNLNSNVFYVLVFSSNEVTYDDIDYQKLYSIFLRHYRYYS